MEFPSNSEQFQKDLQDISVDDWSFTQQSTKKKAKSKIKSQNMLLSLSNNLIAYQNSFKKSKPAKFQSQQTQNYKKRKILKRKINFSSDLQNIPQPHQQLQSDKQNKIQTSNLHQHKKNISNGSENNKIKLQKMFKIMKDFDTLNQTILPFKVNLNKVSHKRILASMAFKQFSLQHHQNTSSVNLIEREKYKLATQSQHGKKKTIETQHLSTKETEYLPIKRRIYSLDIREKKPLMKGKCKIEPSSITNNIFTINREENLQIQKNRRLFSRRKRSYSVRKPSNFICEKSIEQIRSNYSRGSTKFQTKICNQADKIWNQVETICSMGKQCLNGKQQASGKQNEYFSDSRFFTKRQNVKPIKRQALSQMNILNINNCIRK